MEWGMHAEDETELCELGGVWAASMKCLRLSDTSVSQCIWLNGLGSSALPPLQPTSKHGPCQRDNALSEQHHGGCHRTHRVPLWPRVEWKDVHIQPILQHTALGRFLPSANVHWHAAAQH